MARAGRDDAPPAIHGNQFTLKTQDGRLIVVTQEGVEEVEFVDDDGNGLGLEYEEWSGVAKVWKNNNQAALPSGAMSQPVWFQEAKFDTELVTNLGEFSQPAIVEPGRYRVTMQLTFNTEAGGEVRVRHIDSKAGTDPIAEGISQGGQAPGPILVQARTTNVLEYEAGQDIGIRADNRSGDPAGVQGGEGQTFAIIERV